MAYLQHKKGLEQDSIFLPLHIPVSDLSADGCLNLADMQIYFAMFAGDKQRSEEAGEHGYQRKKNPLAQPLILLK